MHVSTTVHPRMASKLPLTQDQCAARTDGPRPNSGLRSTFYCNFRDRLCNQKQCAKCFPRSPMSTALLAPNGERSSYCLHFVSREQALILAQQPRTTMPRASTLLGPLYHCMLGAQECWICMCDTRQLAPKASSRTAIYAVMLS